MSKSRGPKVPIIGRHVGQSIYIGRGITVTVVSIAPDGWVKLAVRTPPNVAVSRDEVSIDSHLSYQAARERGERPMPPGRNGRGL